MKKQFDWLSFFVGLTVILTGVVLLGMVVHYSILSDSDDFINSLEYETCSCELTSDKNVSFKGERKFIKNDNNSALSADRHLQACSDALMQCLSEGQNCMGVYENKAKILIEIIAYDSIAKEFGSCLSELKNRGVIDTSECEDTLQHDIEKMRNAW